jgi:hypothetical protein
MEPITPFYAAKVANVVLAAAGQERIVTPQMMYSYAKNGRIKTVSVEGTKKVHFDADAFKIWLDAYVAGKTSTGKKDVNALAAQYM